MEWSFPAIWDLVGDAKKGRISLILLEELLGETHFKYLEFGTSLSNVWADRKQVPYFLVSTLPQYHTLA